MSLSSRSVFARSASLFAVAALTITTACSDSLTAPTQAAPAAPANGLVGGLLGGVTGVVGDVVNALIPVQALTRDRAIAAPIVRKFTFTKSGGKIEIAEAGLRVDVPSNAIPGNTLTITVTVMPGNSVAYDFQPHGTKFLKPLEFRQDLEGTSWDDSGFKGTINGGYFKDQSQLDLLKGIALLDEIFPVLIKTHEARFNVNHFSGYMVSSGRRGTTSFNSDDSF